MYCTVVFCLGHWSDQTGNCTDQQLNYLFNCYFLFDVATDLSVNIKIIVLFRSIQHTRHNYCMNILLE